MNGPGVVEYDHAESHSSFALKMCLLGGKVYSRQCGMTAVPF